MSKSYLTLLHNKNDSSTFIVIDETRREASLNVEAHNKIVKSQYDKVSHPRVFSEGDLVLVYDQDNDKIGKGKFVPKWFGPLVVKNVLEKEHVS